MKKILVTGFAAATFCGTPALAADMPVRAPAYKAAAPAPYDPWTGCYIGANVGGVWTDTKLTRVQDGTTPVNDTQASVHADGWAYGGQIGCDYRFNNNWVAGVRGMWDGTSARGTAQTPIFNNGNFPDQFYNVKIRAFETVTGRIGILINPTLLVYGTGGVAWVQNHVALTDALAGGQVWATNNTGVGYDVGAGVSWIFAPSWEFWVEYDHIGIGGHNFSVVEQLIVPGRTEVTRLKQSDDKLLVGLNYRFGAH